MSILNCIDCLNSDLMQFQSLFAIKCRAINTHQEIEDQHLSNYFVIISILNCIDCLNSIFDAFSIAFRNQISNNQFALVIEDQYLSDCFAVMSILNCIDCLNSKFDAFSITIRNQMITQIPVSMYFQSLFRNQMPNNQFTSGDWGHVHSELYRLLEFQFYKQVSSSWFVLLVITMQFHTMQANQTISKQG